MTLAAYIYKQTIDFSSLKVREDTNEYPKKKHNKNVSSKLLKRIPLEQLMDLKVDYAFKQLFGNEKNKDITVVFLNAILKSTGRNRIKDISFANTEMGGEYADDKQSRLDLLVLTEANEWINVEIQFANKYDMIERSVYYWSKVFSASFKKGMPYEKLRPVIAINILNFDLFDQTEQFHTIYHLFEDNEKFKLTDKMEFHFIEMGKLLRDWKADKLDPWNDVLARWLLMLGMVDHRNSKIYNDIYAELEAISMKDESLREAFHNWEELSTTQEQRLAYESRLKSIMDDAAFKRKMELIAEEAAENNKEAQQIKEEGMRLKDEGTRLKDEGTRLKDEGIRLKREADQKALETEKRIEKIAQQLLTRGMDVGLVQESTGLSRERIAEIQAEM